MANRARGSRSRNEGYKSVSPTRVPRSAFDLSYGHKTTADPSLLMPLYAQEVMPGDTLSWRPSFLARMTSNVYPYMDGITLEYQAFYCPARILWDNWAKMHGEQTNPGDHTDYTVPQVPAPIGGWPVGSLHDYLGVPTEIDNIEVNALYSRACATIWNEWYRDENLQDALVVPTGDGPDLPGEEHHSIQLRGKRKDRFAGALPFAQKGSPVSLPLGTEAPVVTNNQLIQFAQSNTPSVDNTFMSQTANGFQSGNAWTASIALNFGSESGLKADLTQATAATINEIRMAVSLQHLFERDARGGTRYAEGIYAHFGVRMPDVRYRPELLCVGSVDVKPSEVPQTSATETATPQGNLAAYSKGVGVGQGFHKSFDEWGYVIAFVSLRSEVSYSQGIPAHFLRKTRVDHYVPDLALIGEEAIPSAEIYADGTGWADPDLETGDWAPWGFTPRYESYRHRTNQISGQFRSNIAGDQLRLDQWHFGLDFGSRPVLNSSFIADDPEPILRNLAAELSPPFLLDCFFKVTGVRPMPKFANPGLTRF